MTGCLPDRDLWDLSEGDGADGDREHLAGCRLCQWRTRRLAHDVKVIGAVLHGVPPPASVPAYTGTPASTARRTTSSAVAYSSRMCAA